MFSFTIAAKNLETLSQSVEVAFKKYTEEDKSLCQKLQENRTEQQELQQRLNVLKEHEQNLEEERQKRKEIQEKADQVRYRSRCMKQMQVALCGTDINFISCWLSKTRKQSTLWKLFCQE